MGDQAEAWLEDLPGYCGFAITADGATWATSGFAETSESKVGTVDPAGPPGSDRTVDM